MDRRSFMRLSLAATASGVLIPTAALASDKMSGAGGIYYTKEQPGRWAAKAGGHVPLITLQKSGADTMVEVVTPHEMKEYEHFIVKHILLDKDYGFIDELMFDPTKDAQARSEYKLTGYTGAIYALSVCNKHDTWLSMAEV
ncbi:desulfoferrodoxin family protein [Neptuniibacter halophilus]|uniref:desulfoferrodoxin family protein n=1 Tax=Neptuniibacter halophilus TaxID=651666 RepID=UPI0025728B05|nr:desulfoferrodoxin family protein [Neptuniibacter halophilus]